MHGQIKIKINSEREVITKKGVVIKDLIKLLGITDDVIAATVNGDIVELSYELNEDSNITFINTYDKVGGKIYRAGLQFLYIVAVKELYGEKLDVRIKHSLDKGIYTTVNGKLTKRDVDKIKKKMHELVDLDIKIQKNHISKRKAIEYFNKNKEYEKVELYKQINNDYVTFYELLGYYNYFYYFLPESTGILNKFDLTFVKPNGIVLMYPKGIDGKIPPYHHYEKVLDIFSSYEERMEKLGVSYASDINKLTIDGKISEFIKINEMLQEEEITKMVKKILAKKSIKMILVGGPSSSGKTTTAKKIALKLKEYGKNPVIVSLDDYYKERKDNPKDKDGNYDYETIDAIDIKLFNSNIKDLINYKPVKMPTYNFITGEKEFKKPEIVLKKNDIIVIEGLHTLNDKLTSAIDSKSKYKIYVSPFTPLAMDRHNHISSTDLRLLRRIVRDSRTRGYSAEDTIKQWIVMRNSEEKFVFPYQSEADGLLNTALMYEINILRTYVEPLLYSINSENNNYEEAKRLINFIHNFFSVPDDDVPETSTLREFIGNSYFE